MGIPLTGAFFPSHSDPEIAMHTFDPFGFPFDPWPAVDPPGPPMTPSVAPADDGGADQFDPQARGDDFLQPVRLTDLDCILLSQPAYDEGRAYFADKLPEAACLLLGPKKDTAITHILPDETGQATVVSFTLDAQTLNRRVKPFLAADLDIKGVWHLHPCGVTSLSGGDIAYAGKLFLNPKNAALDRLVMPLTVDGRFHGFVLTRSGGTLCVRRAQLVLF